MTTTARHYFAETVPYGGVEMTRGAMIADLQRVAASYTDDPDEQRAIIDRYLIGFQTGTVIEHKVTLDDRYEGNDEGELRFETTWEQREREKGQMQNWLSRVWLDGIPSAGALPLGPGSNLPVPTTVMIIDGIGEVRYDAEDVVKNPTAADIMEREG